MMAQFIGLLLVLIVPIKAVQPWRNEIVSGEHFNDVVATCDGKRHASKNTILILHKPECVPEMSYEELPSVGYLYILHHDVVKSAKYVWFELSEEDDLNKRYGDQEDMCMKAVFFRHGVSLDAPPIIWKSKQDPITIAEWAWDCIQINLTIHNKYGDTLIVKQVSNGGGEKIRSKFINHGETVTVMSYPGYNVYLMLTDRYTVVYQFISGEEKITLTIEQSMTHPNLQYSIEKAEESEKRSSFWVTKHYLRFVQMLKQPVLLHHYTEKGYKHMKIPDNIYSLLKGHFDHNYENRVAEHTSLNELIVVNKDQVSTTMTHLSQEVIDEVNAQLQPIIENWCNCKLTLSAAFGTREYYYGNVVYMHVDTVVSRVIGAIVQVDQDLKDEDWPLEIIGYDGKRKEIAMRAGEMVLYEAASLIHGRPKIFQGNRYANCLFHFTPLEGWDYKMEGEYLMKGDGPWRESLSLLEFNEDKDFFIKTEL